MEIKEPRSSAERVDDKLERDYLTFVSVFWPMNGSEVRGDLGLPRHSIDLDNLIPTVEKLHSAIQWMSTGKTY